MDDFIRREDAFSYFVTLWECIGTIMDRDEWEDVCMTTANEIPSAQPEIKTDGDTISRQATYLALVEKGQASKRYKLGETWELNGKEIREVLDALPSVQPERKTGRWGEHGECPYCGYLRQWEDDNFCANCGARMNGGEVK